MSDELGAKCELCGEPMPKGEEMFKIHGYSGPCPKPPLPRPECELDALRRQLATATATLARVRQYANETKHDYLLAILDGGKP